MTAMSSSANAALMARHLLRTEFPRAELSDVPGGCFIADDAAWLGITSPQSIEDHEALLKQAQAFAKERELPWAGALLFTSATEAPGPETEALEEALYIYGYIRAKGLNRGGPEMVQVLLNEPQLVTSPQCDFEAAADNLDAAHLLYAEAMDTSDRITGPAWNRSKAWIERAEAWLAYRGHEPAGLVSCVNGELIGRIVMLIVAENHRGFGVGRELLSHAQTIGAHHGAMFTSLWNFREGKLRYYISKQGFAEQLGVRYYLAGQPE
jgi:GNAT superfamily N-acetyltransferase